MIRVLWTSFISFGIGAFCTAAFSQHNPVGEKGTYMLDKASARTSSLILSGSGDASIKEFWPDYEHGPSYPVSILYKFIVRIQGAVENTMRIVMPESYFGPEFMETLRKVGSFETPDFKMAYEGRGDTRTLDGGDYRNCDRVRLYDMKDPEKFGLTHLLLAAAGRSAGELDGADAIENIVLRAYVHPTVPVVGAAKLDVSGKVSGISTKVGLDYKRAL